MGSCDVYAGIDLVLLMDCLSTASDVGSDCQIGISNLPLNSCFADMSSLCYPNASALIHPENSTVPSGSASSNTDATQLLACVDTLFANQQTLTFNCSAYLLAAGNSEAVLADLRDALGFLMGPSSFASQTSVNSSMGMRGREHILIFVVGGAFLLLILGCCIYKHYCKGDLHTSNPNTDLSAVSMDTMPTSHSSGDRGSV